MGKKIGILGGTFNPIHNAHIKLANDALINAGLDEVWIMPTGCSYLKQQKDIASAADRLAMVELAIQNEKGLVSSDVELRREGNTYTYETLELLCDTYPDTVFYWILGADNLYSMENWKHPEVIFAKAVILAAVREDKNGADMEEQIHYLEDKYGARVQLLGMDNTPISSTQIRNRCEGGDSIDTMVPAAVADYIRSHQLYR